MLIGNWGCYNCLYRQNAKYQRWILDGQREELEQRTTELDAREAALEKWEAALNERQATLDQRETERMQHRTEAERQERVAAIERLDGIRGEVGNALAVVRALAGPLNEARDLCSGSFLTPYLKQLCRIARSMYQSGEQAVVLYANELTALLCQLGCEPIRPQPGQPIDYMEAVKLDAAQAGEIVAAVCVNGWKRDGQVLEKAIVTVKEEA